MIVTPPSFRPSLAPVAAPQTLTFAFRGHEVLLAEPGLTLPDEAACAALGLDVSACHPIGLFGDAYCRSAAVPREWEPAPGFVFRKLRSLFGRWDEDLLAVAGRAFQVADWAATHRFCGACGGPTRPASGERVVRCDPCGLSFYPRIAPAMMVLVRRGRSILLARNVAAPPGRFSALAGFVDPGESVEEAIHREVKEEVGLAVKDLRYFGSQSWPFPHSLMVAFTAEYAGGELAPDPAEIAEARWVGPGDPLPELSPPQSISRALLDAHLP